MAASPRGAPILLMRVEWTTWIEKEGALALANRIGRRIYDAVQAVLQQPSLGRSGRVAGARELVIYRHELDRRLQDQPVSRFEADAGLQNTPDWASRAPCMNAHRERPSG